MTIGVIDTVVPKNGNTFPVAIQSDVKGGYQVFADTTARDAFDSRKLVEGMRCHVVASSADFRLGSDLSTWTEIVSGGGGGGVDSVNTRTGDVVLDASDVGADPTGTASTAVTDHTAASDPHGDRAFATAAVATLAGTLGDAATLDVGTTAGTVAAGDDDGLVAARRRVGVTTIGSNTFDVDLSATSLADQRRAADGAVTLGVTGMASGVDVTCHITNTTGSDIDISVVDDIAWDGGEAPSTTLGAGLTLTLAMVSLSTTSEAVQAAWMVGEVPA